MKELQSHIVGRAGVILVLQRLLVLPSQEVFWGRPCKASPGVVDVKREASEEGLK